MLSPHIEQTLQDASSLGIMRPHSTHLAIFNSLLNVDSPYMFKGFSPIARVMSAEVIIPTS